MEDGKKPCILHIAKMTGVAGTENHLLTLLPGLAAHGLDIRLIVLNEPDKQMTDYAAQMSCLGVPSETMPIDRDVEFGLIGRLADRIRAIGPDAVHTHLIHADWHGIPAARRAGVRRVFCSGHNDDPFRRRLPIRLVQRYLWARLDAGIAISEAVRQFMIRVEGAPPRKVHTIHYGLNVAPDSSAEQVKQRALRDAFRQELGIPADAKVIGTVSRLIEQKGLPYGIQAFHRLADQLPSAHYVILGEGPMRGPLQEQIQAAGLTGRVHLPGWRTDAAARMAAFDIFLLPSLWEGFGLVVLEAMAARLPVVASAVSALPEIVRNAETGYLVLPRDVETLTDRLARLLRDPELAARLGAAGRAHLEAEFSVGKMLDRTAALYTQYGIVPGKTQSP